MTERRPPVERFQWSDGIALSEELVAVDREGGCHVPGFLPPQVIDALSAEIAEGSFEEQSGRYLRAEQRLASYELSYPFTGYPWVAAVGRFLEDAVRNSQTPIEGLMEYRPNRAGVHRYPPGEVGITPHYDEKRFGLLVASLTICGESDFIIRDEPSAEEGEDIVTARLNAPIRAQWHTEPGSLVLLRAPGFGGIPDGRPLHQVTGGKGGRPRLALVYRMLSEE